MKRKIFLGLGVAVAVIVVLAGGLVGFSAVSWDNAREVEDVALVASTDSAVVARGRYLAYGPAHCAYCHNTADRSEDAGIPAVQVCAGCHIPGGVAAVGARADSAGVQQLVEYWNEQRPIEWQRIHKLPDHVHFPHMMHINAEIECQECHGQVQEMREIERVAPMSMGWCVQCHERRAVRTDCFVCHY